MEECPYHGNRVEAVVRAWLARKVRWVKYRGQPF